MFEHLDDTQRRARVLAYAYERERRKVSFGYRIFHCDESEIINSPIFKTFVTLVSWLAEKQWTVTWHESHWSGYVEFVFKDFAPDVPQPGKLKNEVLLKKYILAIPDNDTTPNLSKEQLENLYAKILRPEIKNDQALMKRLGFDDIRIE